MIKRQNPDTVNGVGDVNAHQTVATIERSIFNAGHVAGDGNVRQASAVTVFVNLFISTTYVLNGRKVIA